MDKKPFFGTHFFDLLRTAFNLVLWKSGYFCFYLFSILKRGAEDEKRKIAVLENHTFFPLLICLVYVNVVGDASNYFHDINKDIAKSLLSGKAAGSNTGNDNEQEIKAFLIQGMKKEVDTIAIGPSLVTYIGREAVGTESFYNLGVTNISTGEKVSFEASGDKIEAIYMIPGWTHNIMNMSETEDLVTVMICNENFDPKHPDTFFEKV